MQLPGPVRAVVGLLANAAEEAKHLPERAIELPMLAVSTALQASMRAQQRYARLAARGEEVLTRRPLTDEPPAWATFDDPVSIAADLRRGTGTGTGTEGDEQGRAAGELLDQLLGPDEDDPLPAVTVLPVRKAPARKPPPRPAPPLKSTARKATAAEDTPVATARTPGASTPATKPAAKKAAAKTSPAARKAPAKRASDATARGKSVSKPRHTAPSRFDAVADD